jgi:hypothetical protein
MNNPFGDIITEAEIKRVCEDITYFKALVSLVEERYPDALKDIDINNVDIPDSELDKSGLYKELRKYLEFYFRNRSYE